MSKTITSLVDLVPDDRNANLGTPRGRGLVETSLQKYGAGRSILVDRNGKVIAGNKTSEAAAAIGMEGVVVVQTTGAQLVVVQRTDLDLDEDTAARELAIADNRASEIGLEWDTEVLAELGAEIDLSTFWTKDEIGLLLEQDVTSGGGDDAPEVQDGPTRVQPGELWQLGRHRLLCGDSTVKVDVDRLLQGERTSMVLTDPPYGIDLETDYTAINIGSKMVGNSVKRHTYAPVAGDDQPFDASAVYGLDGVKEQFWFGADYYAQSLGETEHEGSWLVWDKRKPSQDEGFGSGFELIWSKQRHKRILLRFEWFGFLSGGDREAINRQHPTQKPSTLYADIMQRWGNEGDIVYDPFAGSGPTVIAAERTNRKARVVELSPHYCDVILTRWESETGLTAERIDG